MRASPAFALIVLALCGGGSPTQASTPSLYAAVAYSPAMGRYGYAYNHASRASAESSALSRCRAWDARIVAWVRSGTIVLLVAADGRYAYSWASGPDTTSAYNRALTHLRRRTGSRVRTYVRVFSGG